MIARSFAFIYGRNQPSLGLLGFNITNDDFYKVAQEGSDITIDLPRRVVEVAKQEFNFTLSQIEYHLTTNKGIAQSFKKYGKRIWEEITAGEEPASEEMDHVPAVADSRLNW